MVAAADLPGFVEAGIAQAATAATVDGIAGEIAVGIIAISGAIGSGGNRMGAGVGALGNFFYGLMRRYRLTHQ